jgi:hypothetical protein
MVLTYGQARSLTIRPSVQCTGERVSLAPGTGALEANNLLEVQGEAREAGGGLISESFLKKSLTDWSRRGIHGIGLILCH